MKRPLLLPVALLVAWACILAALPVVQASCDDAVHNDAETDVDCGGPACDACAVGKSCSSGSDCEHGSCSVRSVRWRPPLPCLTLDALIGSARPPATQPTMFTCLAATCWDGIHNGAETGTDCGGPCSSCEHGMGCAVASDCASGVCRQNICSSPTCSDGVQNGDETDVDCGAPNRPVATAPNFECGWNSANDAVCSGGQCCSPFGYCGTSASHCEGTSPSSGAYCPMCADGKSCANSGDCISGVCSGGSCQPPSCTDNVANGMEMGIDCGGPCPLCEDGSWCNTNTGCASGICSGNRCAAPSCTDGVQNGDEASVDCGGATCDGCADGDACTVGGDCTSMVCAASTCASPSCTDAVSNGDETGIDCGGALCSACAAGSACNSGADCASGVCSGGVCATPSCSDSLSNGDETGVDCGGSTCGGCADGGPCNTGSDCATGVCDGGVCGAPTCTDGKHNGNESDVDCGGPDCVSKCVPGQACAAMSDCDSGSCDVGSSWTCNAPTCEDGLKNGDETDVDCGGGCASPCDHGKTCGTANDCASGVCRGGLCSSPVCTDGVKNGEESGALQYQAARMPVGASHGNTHRLLSPRHRLRSRSARGGGGTRVQVRPQLPEQCRVSGRHVLQPVWLLRHHGVPLRGHLSLNWGHLHGLCRGLYLH